MPEIETSGPLFNAGALDSEVAGMVHQIETEIAARGWDLVQSNLAGSLRHPTGYYQSRVQVRDTPDGRSVNDGGVVYGPWLEGTGSRNRTTRFKGYFSFRRASQELDAIAPAIAEKIVAEFCVAVS